MTIGDIVDPPYLKKKGYVVVAVLFVWLLLCAGVVWPWIRRVDLLDFKLSFLASMNAAAWWIILLWAFHNLAFQLISLFKRPANLASNTLHPAIAVLYTTCDDFNPKSLLSCLDQNYDNFRVLVCDDSTEDKYRDRIEAFFASHASMYPSTKFVLVQRPKPENFKAGNLNYAIIHKVRKEEEWILLVDADQLLPSTYLSELVAWLPPEDADQRIAFVQAAHDPIVDEENSGFFEKALAPEVLLFYGRDLVCRQTYGFIPLLGHGAMIRKSAWKAIDHFPLVVSEDFAFALKARSKNMQGLYVEDVTSFEALPQDFGGFMIRLKKFAGGTAQLICHELGSFLKGGASLIEKWDFCIAISWYALMPLLVLNGFLSGYVIHKLWLAGVSVLHPALPYLFIGMLLVIWVLCISVTNHLITAIRFYFWSTAIYAAAIPVAGFTFIKHLFKDAPFLRTPKGEDTPLPKLESWIMFVLGILASSLAIYWLSPFTPFLLGQGIAYASYPLYGKLSAKSSDNTLARSIIYVPGLLMIAALYAMWHWASF